ncbi:hypothetical protein KXD40_005320 [Peronospora effusa]|nr:hypothetical protein KXD40_005320 [Peronospora effusa]
MICCGLSLDATGFWHVKQLTPELQAIIAKYENYFEGELGFPPGVAAASIKTPFNTAPFRSVTEWQKG